MTTFERIYKAQELPIFSVHRVHFWFLWRPSF